MTAGRNPVSIGVAGFQGDIEENIAATRHAMGELGIDGTVVPVRYPEEIEAIDGLVIPGGESTVMSTLASAQLALPVVKKRITEGMPVLGTCAGMIMLSKKAFDRVVGDTKQKLLGALDIVIERNAFGRQNDSFEADLDIHSLGRETFRGVFIRAPAVTEVGPGVEVLARFDKRTVAVRQGSIIATAFHPELSSDSRIHRQFLELAAGKAGARPSG